MTEEMEINTTLYSMQSVLFVAFITMSFFFLAFSLPIYLYILSIAIFGVVSLVCYIKNLHVAFFSMSEKTEDCDDID